MRSSHLQEAAPGSEVEIAVPFAVRPGDRVFKTHDERLISEARLSFTGTGRLKVPIRVIVRARQGEPLELEAVDAEGIRAAVKGDAPGGGRSEAPPHPGGGAGANRTPGQYSLYLGWPGLRTGRGGHVPAERTQHSAAPPYHSPGVGPPRPVPAGASGRSEGTAAALWSSLRQDAVAGLPPAFRRPAAGGGGGRLRRPGGGYRRGRLCRLFWRSVLPGAGGLEPGRGLTGRWTCAGRTMSGPT